MIRSFSCIFAYEWEKDSFPFSLFWICSLSSCTKFIIINQCECALSISIDDHIRAFLFVILINEYLKYKSIHYQLTQCSIMCYRFLFIILPGLLRIAALCYYSRTEVDLFAFVYIGLFISKFFCFPLSYATSKILLTDGLSTKFDHSIKTRTVAFERWLWV